MNINWKVLYNHLTGNGFDVYSMGQHKGECKTPYIVLKSRGSDLYYSVSDRLFEVLMYYPADHYSEFQTYIDSIKETMRSLFPYVRMASDESEHYLDDDIHAYMVSLLYRAPKVAHYIHD